MTDKTTPDGVRPSQAILAVADRHFEASLLRLDAIIQGIASGESGAERELSGALQAVRKAVEVALSERARFDKMAGGGANAPTPALDLDGARAEIGRRLVCLRAAGSGGGVSGQPE